jgi:hypothetical protein
MAVLLNPGEYVLNVVAHVPAELKIRRARVGQAPVFQSALGQPEQLRDLTLGEKRRGDLRCRVHTQKVCALHRERSD